MKRVILIVLDSVGCGELPDAHAYFDEGSNTLANIKKAVPSLSLPRLHSLGLSKIEGLECFAADGVGVLPSYFGRAAERSPGKDTTTGHWEIGGVALGKPFPTYPNGFPDDVIRRFEQLTGRKVLGNKTASGTEIIKELGDAHVETGALIVYTSADSVFQIAAHEGVVDIERQYEISRIAREMLCGEHAVARVITRPFTGTSGNYRRTSNRRDFSLVPPSDTILDVIKAKGLETAAVGKIEDIFAGRGTTRAVHTKNNDHGVNETLNYMKTVENGLIFTNLVDFDMLFGHRNDIKGYADALAAFDARLPEILDGLRDGDLLIITADHGCDPTTPSTDHSREYIPVLAYNKNMQTPTNIGTRGTFADIGQTVMDWLEVGENALLGDSFL